MKTIILTFSTILACSINLFAASPPSKYSSRAVRGSDGRTIGREVERSSSGIKYHELYNMSGKRIAQTRQTSNPYYRSSKK